MTLPLPPDAGRSASSSQQHGAATPPRRPPGRMPRWLTPLLLLAVLLQGLWQSVQPAPRAQAAALQPAPPLALLQLASLGEPVALAKALMLYVQSHDEQAAVSIAFGALDYPRVLSWLQASLALDPRSQYPLLAASQVYAAVSDPVRARLMLDFVYDHYRADPQRRWPWLAHAALVARHQLHDMALARRYAEALRTQAGAAQLPAWARELEIFIAADMDQAESARTLIGALIASGQIRDPHELAFLAQRLEQLAPPHPKR